MDAARSSRTRTDAGAQLDATGDVLYIKASNPNAQDWFGTAISLSGQWLAVGAPNESSRSTGIDGDGLDNSEDRSGAVYLFSNSGSGWAQRHYLKASNPEAVDGFGKVLALSGNTLAVGSPFEDSPASGINGDQGNGPGGNYGAVYTFVESGGEWQQEAYIKASSSDVVDLFGSSVALERDVLVVGAPWEDSAARGINGDQTDNSAKDSGAVYIFSRSADGWAQTAYLKASNAAAGDEFGYAVAISGTTIIVGAPGQSSSAKGVNPVANETAAAGSGAVYLFELSGSTYHETAFVKASNTDADDGFGAIVALDGDTFAVGAFSESTSNGDGTQSNNVLPDSGAVYVFERSAGTWTQTAYLKSANAAAEYNFGSAVALNGKTLVVGAIGEDRTSKPGSGAAYVFERNTDTWGLQKRITAPNAETNDLFGSGLALTPTLMAIGAIGEASNSTGINGDSSNNQTPGAGAVFLYAR